MLRAYGILAKIETEAVAAMCAKKKASSNKTWKLAGESIYSTPLTSAEREKIEKVTGRHGAAYFSVPQSPPCGQSLHILWAVRIIS